MIKFEMLNIIHNKDFLSYLNIFKILILIIDELIYF